MLIRLSFGTLTLLMMLCIIIFVSSACWEMFFMGHCFKGVGILFCLILVIFIIALLQQYLLWLLPKKERNFHEKSIF